MNSSLHDMTDDLLVKFLLCETSPEEEMRVVKWINANAENNQYFTQFKIIWDNSKQLEAVSTLDVNEAWLRFKKKANHIEKNEAVVRPFRGRFYWLRIAAVLFIIAGGSWLALTLIKNLNTLNTALVNIETQKNILIDTLPDGSIVTINKNSSISYPKKFNGRLRSIALKGEAFFNVSPDKNKPFIISVNDVIVKVVGTSFNIKSVNGKIEVIVETGIVEVVRNNKSIQLNPKEKLTVIQNEPAFSKENTNDKLYNYFRSKEFVCDSTPLWRVAEVLSEAYDTSIIIERKELRNELLTTTFNNESLDRILNVIAETFSATIVKKGNQVIIK